MWEYSTAECYGSSGQDDGGWAPLTWATENMRLEQMKMLISAGADVQIRDKVCVCVFQLFDALIYLTLFDDL